MPPHSVRSLSSQRVNTKIEFLYDASTLRCTFPTVQTCSSFGFRDVSSLKDPYPASFKNASTDLHATSCDPDPALVPLSQIDIVSR
jgi:hypothetical protein